MCTLLSVTRASYYSWLKRPISPRDIENQELGESIEAIFNDSRRTYGTRRIRKILQRAGITISRRRVGKIMKQLNIGCKKKVKYNNTTDSNHNLPIASNNLDRNFVATKPNQKYVGDITYIWTNEGWLYLAIVIDLFSRKVVGWSLDNKMTASLVNNALLMAIQIRKPDEGLIWHTDRGSQYASDSHLEIINTHGIIQSMSRKGNCWDNAVAESFFGTLKTELIYSMKITTMEEIRMATFEYIEVFYNRKRLHSANDYYSPEQYEARMNVH
jgi:putative transposase